jgi:hypothetical protein
MHTKFDIYVFIDFATLVGIITDCTGSWKSKYHTIMATIPPHPPFYAMCKQHTINVNIIVHDMINVKFTCIFQIGKEIRM